MKGPPPHPAAPDSPGHAADPVRARKKAMDYLARREQGRQELLAKLESAGFEPETASAALEQLARDGLQDDRRFAESFVRSRIDQGKGPVRIRLELQQRGLDGSLVDEVLHAASEDWGALARQVRGHKFGSAQPVDFPEKARQMRFLQYRGFESEHIRLALDETG